MDRVFEIKEKGSAEENFIELNVKDKIFTIPHDFKVICQIKESVDKIYEKMRPLVFYHCVSHEKNIHVTYFETRLKNAQELINFIKNDYYIPNCEAEEHGLLGAEEFDEHKKTGHFRKILGIEWPKKTKYEKILSLPVIEKVKKNYIDGDNESSNLKELLGNCEEGINRCMVCNVDMGDSNPRQLCRKTYCEIK